MPGADTHLAAVAVAYSRGVPEDSWPLTTIWVTFLCGDGVANSELKR
jgi:hypothetical protein